MTLPRQCAALPVASSGRSKPCAVRCRAVAAAAACKVALPGIFLNEATTGVFRPWRGSCYTHVGVELPLDFFKVGDLAAVHDLGTYISLLQSDKKPHLATAASARDRDDGGGVLAKVMEFVGRQRASTLPWQDAALQMGGLVQTLGLI
ncbi:hypothetical protein ABZP36_017306 [Zizania latifolia]